MPDPFGQLLTRWTIRLALVCYVACLAALLVRRGKPAPMQSMVRWLWTLGCGLFVTHVICAFGFYHHFSHLAAYEDTARQTEEMLGFPFGGGIYFSYLFTLLWIADTAWRWIGPLSRPAWLDWPLHAYMFFISFNGAIVFEGGMSRWGGMAACILLAAAVARRIWGRLPPAETSGTMGSS